MPTYEYECDACGHAFEKLQRMSDPAVRKCPSCGRLKVRRLISGGAGVIFKGSGFYETDYKRGRSGAKPSKDAPKDSEGCGAGACESKPAAEATPACGGGACAAEGPKKKAKKD